MPTVIIDTNLLIRIATGDLPKQAIKALKLIQKHQPGDILLTEAVVAEIVFVLSSTKQYRFSRSDTITALREVLITPQFSCDQKLLNQALKTYSTSKLDFVDCLILAHHQLGRIKQILTLDKTLLKAIK